MWQIWKYWYKVYIFVIGCIKGYKWFILYEDNCMNLMIITSFTSCLLTFLPFNRKDINFPLHGKTTKHETVEHFEHETTKVFKLIWERHKVKCTTTFMKKKTGWCKRSKKLLRKSVNVIPKHVLGEKLFFRNVQTKF